MDKKRKLVFILHPQCGHCKDALPSFKMFMDDYRNRYNFEVIDISKINKNEVYGVKLEGFPTFLIQSKNGGDTYKSFDFVDDNGRRSYTELVRVLKKL
jgi:thiol-disulfide isomerase/thioredoxin